MRLYKIALYWLILALVGYAGVDCVFAQVYAKITMVDQAITTTMAEGKLVTITTKVGKGTPVKLTVLDADFAAAAGNQQVDVRKSIAVALIDAKKDKVTLGVCDDKGHKIKCDPSKDSDKSIIDVLEAAVKNGYKKDKVKEDKVDDKKTKAVAHYN